MSSCRFYGKNGMFGMLIDQGGNQCALIIESYSPCAMEIQKGVYVEIFCPIVDQRAQLATALLAKSGAAAREIKEPCKHDRLNEDGQCRQCGSDQRGGI